MSGFSAITWVNGSTAVNQTNMQRYDDWIQQFEGDASVTTLNGSTSGTAKLYPVLQGKYKKFIVRCDNFRNGGGSAQTIALPTAFTDCAEIRTWDFAYFQLLNSGSAITMYYLSSIGASGFGATSLTSAAGTSAPHLILHTSGVQPFDTISFPGSQASAVTGFMIVEGI